MNCLAPRRFNDPMLKSRARKNEELELLFDKEAILADEHINLFFTASEAVCTPERIPAS